MPMDKTSMANFIKSSMLGLRHPSLALPKLSFAMKTYIETNCQIALTLPPPNVPPSSPDPITSYVARVTFPTFNITLPITSDPITALAALSLSITTSVNSGIITPADPTFIVTPGTFLPTPLFLTLSKISKQQEALEHLCDEIIRWLKQKVNSVPLLGTHLTFVVPFPGAVMTSIS
jgi:hypothetical protein